MNYKIRWSSSAYTDFYNIVFYIKESWGRKPAENFISHLEMTIKTISYFPKIGFLLNPKKEIRAFVISKQTKLIYRIKSGSIIILNLFDTGRTLKNSMFRNLKYNMRRKPQISCLSTTINAIFNSHLYYSTGTVLNFRAKSKRCFKNRRLRLLT